MNPVDAHEALHFIRVIRPLHRLLDICDEVLNLVLLLLRQYLGFLALQFQLSNRILLLLHVLLHLLETLGLHVKQFLQVVQVLLQALNLLLFRLQTGLHLESAMS